MRKNIIADIIVDSRKYGSIQICTVLVLICTVGLARKRRPLHSPLNVGVGTRQNGKKTRTGTVAVVSLLLLGGVVTQSEDALAEDILSLGKAVEASEPALEAANPIQDISNDRRIYVGVGAGRSVLEPDTREVPGIDVTEENQLGVQITLGKDLGRRFSVEGHYADLGSAELTQNAEISYEELGLSALAYVGRQANREQRRGLLGFGRVGLGYLRNDASGNINFEKENGVHLILGLGAEYASRSGLAIRAEALLFDEDVYYTQLALVYRFGSKRTRDAGLHVSDETAVSSIQAEQEQVALVAGLPQVALVTGLPQAALVIASPQDSDGDRVPDNTDECPFTAKQIMVDNLGCEVISGILQGVNFESGSATLKDESMRRLDHVGRVLRAFREASVLLSAHTDVRGSADINMALSRARGLAVAKYLVSTGVGKKRFEVRAFGETRSIADNGTEEGRHTNRRVEIKVMRDD